MDYRSQRFLILDSDTAKIIGEKKRKDIHRDGDWHRATNAFILREGKASEIEILIQERSKYVDIAENKLDQSLATQLIVEDKNAPKRAILRGLKEELGITPKDIARIENLHLLNNWKIVKRYSYNRDLWNREIVNSFGVILKQNKVSPNNIRVKAVNWIGWDDFCNLVQIKPKKFTKTARMFCVNEEIFIKLERCFKKLLNNKRTERIRERYFYFSFYYYDVGIWEKENGRYNIEIYDTRYSMKLINKYLNVKKFPVEILSEGDNDILSKEYLFNINKNRSRHQLLKEKRD